MKELFYDILDNFDTLKLKIKIKKIKKKVEKMSYCELNIYFHEIIEKKYKLCKPELLAQIESDLKYFEKTMI